MPLKINKAPPLIHEPSPEAPWLRALAYLFLPLSALILCVALIVFGIDLWRDREQVRSDNEQNLHTIAHALAQHTARTLQAIDLTLVGVADSLRDARIDWHDPDHPAVPKILAEKRERAAFVRSLFLVGANGRLIHELNNYPAPPLDFSDRPYFAIHRDNATSDMYVGTPVMSRIIKVPILALSRRLETPDGAFDGVVAAAIEPRLLEESFKEMNPSGTSVIAVFRSDGQLLLRYPERPADSPNRIDLDNRRRFMEFSHKAFVGDSPIDGVRRIYFSERVPGAQAFVVIGYAESTVFASWRRSMMAYATIAPIVLIAFAGLSFLLFRYMTRRELLVQALQQSEIRFRDFATAASDRLWETDENHRFTWHSGSHEKRFLGLTRWGKKDMDAELDEPWKSHKADLDAHRPFRDFVYDVHKKDGTIRHRRISGMPIYDMQGVFKGYRGVYRDITAEVLTQRQATIHRDRFMRAIESLAEGFALFDADDKLVVCNTQFRELSQPIADRLIQGTTFEEFLHASLQHDLIPEARGNETAWLEQRMAQHRNPPNIMEILRGNRWYQVREQRDRDGGTLLFVLDIHEQKMTELQNKTLHERVRLQFECMPAACLMLSRELKIIDWNPAAERIFGYQRDEILGRSPYSTIIPAAAERQVKEVMERLLGGEMSVATVNENRTKIGDIITCEWLNTPIFDNDKKCIGIVSMALDITEKRKAEEKLRQAQRMEAVGQLTGGIAHDFNNLLQVIFGNAEILMQGLKDRPQLGRWAEMIKTAADRGASLTQRLLAFSRQQVLAPTTVDLRALINDFIELLNLTLGENIDILADIEDNLGTLMLDVGQLENALLNLALNARDAMPKGGRLIFAARAMPLPDGESQSDAALNYVALSVTDTGTGMSPSVAKRAFEPFFTTKDVDKGSGLGLSMVYGFVKQSGGHVKIDSQLGRGTTVTMWFPQKVAARPVLPKKAASKTNALPTGTERILVVEDDDMVRSYVTTQLDSLGYRVSEAADGTTALNMLANEGPVDLLFTDMIMPGQMSGRELAEAVAARFPSTRILFTSGYTEKAGDGHLYLPPGAHLLSKPYYRQDLARRVREVLDLRIAAAS